MPHTPAARVLVVDDDPLVARSVARVLTDRGIVADHIGRPEEIARFLEQIDHDTWDAIVLDVNLAEVSGLDVLAQLRRRGVPTAVVMLTGEDNAATATAALRGGAFHYVVKPPAGDALVEAVEQAIRHTVANRALVSQDGDVAGIDQILVGASPGMVRLRTVLSQVAGSPVNVLVAGESGTGKELVAHTLHDLSPRKDRPFVAINCAAIPESLIDSELFGHTRGAFTGATGNRPGVFVEADGGTLFLDEIGDMPMAVQARLLRALQEGEVRAVGSDSVRAVDVRVVAATNVDLARAVRDGRFRADLYFRLNVVTLEVPPLRDRPGDVPLLVAALLSRHCGATTPTVPDDTLRALSAYAWPGNVRELENALLHCLALSTGTSLQHSALPGRVRASDEPSRPVGSGLVDSITDDVPLAEAKRRAALAFERKYLLRVLDQSSGSVSGAARLSGIDRTNFRRLLQRHNIDPGRFRS